MGGAMSLHMGYRIIPNIGGVFALSSFLNSDSLLYEVKLLFFQLSKVNGPNCKRF